MSSKETKDDKDKDLEIDLEDFERQIDDEIDRLFVPLGSAAEASPELAAEVEKPRPKVDRPVVARPVSDDVSLKQPAPPKETPMAKEPPVLEIPPVFEVPPQPQEPPVLEMPSQAKASPAPEETAVLEVPPAFEMPPVSKEPPVLEMPPQPQEPPPFEEPLQFREPAPRPADERVALERKPEADVTISLAGVAPVSEKPEPEVTPVPDFETTELSELLESFNVAFLSLDWDFSSENVARLDSSLVKLAPYCQKIHEAQTLYKIMKVVLLQLTSEPSSASSQVLELVRDSQELLKDLLLSETGVDSQKRGQFKNLINQARTLRNEGLLGTKAPSEPVVEKRPAVQVERVEVPPVVIPQEVENIAAVDWRPLKALKEWMDWSRAQSSSAAQRLQDESKRILQIEQVLGKTPVLAPVVARMGSVRSVIESCVSSLNEKDREWEKRINWVMEFEKRIEEVLARTWEQTSQEKETPELEAAALEVPEQMAPEEEVPEASAALSEEFMEIGSPVEEQESLAAETRQEEVCLYRLSGKRFAVPASVVVKIEQVSSKKANKIRERGFATLTDFKPIFRSLKTGVMGRWSELPADLLKSFMFLPLPYRNLRAPGVPSIAGTAILVSSGDNHGIIFAEPDGVNLQVETITPVGDEKGVLGVIRSEESSPIEVLNIEEILKELNESEGEENQSP